MGLWKSRLCGSGRNAEEALERGFRFYIRHPSYGGKDDFIKGFNEIYGIKSEEPKDQKDPKNKKNQENEKKQKKNQMKNRKDQKSDDSEE